MRHPARTSPAPSTGRGERAGRVTGLDVARAVAVLGMVMVHFGPSPSDTSGVAGTLYAVPNGRAAILFIVLAGVGVAVMARRASRTLTGAQLGVRAVLLLIAGFALELLHVDPHVILQYYAAYFLVAAVILGLSDRVLLVLACVVAMAAPIGYLAVWHLEPAWFAGEVVAHPLHDPWTEVGRELLVSGAYPVLTWSAPLALGLWLGRRDLRAPDVHRRMLVVGAAVAVAAWALARALGLWLPINDDEPSWWLLGSDAAHSQMPLWLISAGGAATAVIGAALHLADRLPRAVAPAVAVGKLALTVYVAHLLALAAWPGLARDHVGEAAVSVALFAAVAVAAAMAWLRWFDRGPLEAALRWPTARLRR